ncbi:PQQ-binding-like beta-propeller repeat protein [bacterium]|nr:PQQ-binding-like beta-propeller repeat protein [bacterium]
MLIPLLVFGIEITTDSELGWPQWRGPDANGVAPNANPPIEWSESKNIKWKTEIPGLGHATPIIWGHQIFILSAIETDDIVEPGQGKRTKAKKGFIPFTVGTSKIHKFEIFALNRSDGHIIWQQTACEALPHEGFQTTGSWASNSPVTDGEHIYANFGSRGLFCYDMQGQLIWDKDFGDMNITRNFGEGSSPALYQDKIIVTWDHEDQSFIIALDKISGQEIWRSNRNEGTSWATPLIVQSKGKTQVITSASKRVRSYDLATGDLLWESRGLTKEVIPSPVASNDMVYVMSGEKRSALLAINISRAKGDISASNSIVWKLDRDTPYIPSPLLYDNSLYFLKKTDATLACFNASTGEEFFTRQRLEGLGYIYASPVGADGRIYITSLNGSTKVIKHDTQFQVIATNKLEDSFTASPVIVGNELYLRGAKYLYCISEK